MRESDLLGYIPGPVGGGRSSARDEASAPPRTRVRGRSGGASAAAVLRAVGPLPGSPVIGYASIPGPGRRREARARAPGQSDHRGVRVPWRSALEVVREREPSSGKALSRPGLAYAMERISIGEVSGLVVSELYRVTRSAAELGRIIEWLDRSHARFIAATHGFDTDEVEGHLAADLLVEVSRWESERLQRTNAKRASGRSGQRSRPRTSRGGRQSASPRTHRRDACAGHDVAGDRRPFERGGCADAQRRGQMASLERAGGRRLPAASSCDAWAGAGSGSARYRTCLREVLCCAGRAFKGSLDRGRHDGRIVTC